MDEFESVRIKVFQPLWLDQLWTKISSVRLFWGTCRGTACSHTDLEKFQGFWGFQLRLGGLGAVAVSRDVLVRGLI